MHYYGGNRGPLFHLADKVEVSPEEVEAAEARRPGGTGGRRGGGSLLDYLGYGTTLGTWFMNGEAPIEVTAVVDETPGIEVDQHSITICRYARGLSKLETRWGTLTDPWTHPAAAEMRLRVGRHRRQPSRATTTRTSSRCRRGANRRRHRSRPTPCRPGRRGPIEYMLARIADGAPIAGPLDPALSLIGQRIIDSAVLSSTEKRTVALVP